VVDSIILDTTPPNSGYFKINSDVTYTNQTGVTLNNIGANDTYGVAQMRYKNDASGATWTTLAFSTDPLSGITLLNTEGTRNMTMQFKDNAGNWSGDVTDTIVLDTSGPTGTLSINGGAGYTKDRNITIATSASDNLSGVSYYRIKEGDSNLAGQTEVAYSTGMTISFTVSLGDASKQVNIQYKDGAGNWSQVYSSSIVLDQRAPDIAFTGSSPANYSFNTTTIDKITVNMTISDPTGGSGLSAKTAVILDASSNYIKTYNDLPYSAGEYQIVWDGTDRNGYYVNEGTYTLIVGSTDAVGNGRNAEQSIVLKDEIQLSSSSIDHFYPEIKRYDDGAVKVYWRQNEQQDYTKVDQYIGKTGDDKVWSSSIYIDYPQTIKLYKYSTEGQGTWQIIGINEYLFYTSDANTYTGDSSAVYIDVLMNNAGNYKIGGFGGYSSRTSIGIKYKNSDLRESISNSNGISWSSDVLTSNTSQPISNYSAYNSFHKLYISNGNLYYQRLNPSDKETWSSSVIISNSGTVSDVNYWALANGEVYVVWTQKVGSYKQIYYQKIPRKIALLADQYYDVNLQQGLKVLGYTYQSPWSSYEASFSSLVYDGVESQSIQKDWGSGNCTYPNLTTRDNYFSLRWSGYIKIEQNGYYQFYVNSDDGTKLWVNNQLIIDDWRGHATEEHSGSIYLNSGYYPITFEYLEVNGAANVKLGWRKPSDTSTIYPIPSNVLYYSLGYNSSTHVLNKQVDISNIIPRPTLISPINSEIISTPKPRFIWSVPQQSSDLSFYKLQLQQQNSPLDTQVVTADIDYTYDLNAGDVSIKTGPTNNEISYQLNDYQSLAATNWLWRIGADFVPTDGIEAYTYSDSAAFSIEPDLSLTNVLNFPNPFESSTKIRYKLSKSVDEVIIYIFNLAGKLVRTLEGNTSGTSVAKEYHDIIWDGRNDLGEPVNNGLYPYKITATLNGRKVSEKGKAVRMR